MRKIHKSDVRQVLALGLACVMTVTGMGLTDNMGNNVYAAATNVVSDSTVAMVSEGAVEIVTNEIVSVPTSDAAKIALLHNPISDNEKEIVEYSYVYFGEYPQSEVTGDALTENIINAQYVSGDAVVGREKYCRLENEEGTYRYFVYEPIRWRVIKIKDNEAILRSDLILDSQVFSEEGVYYWVDASLRDWLNSYDLEQRGFLNRAFTSDEAYAINAKMFDDSMFADAYGRDKVYLLSGAELYGLGGVRYPYQLKTKSSDYAFASGVLNPGQDGYASWWVGMNKEYSMEKNNGYVDESGIRYEAVWGKNCTNNYLMAISQTSKGIGVCPAIVLDLEKTQVWCTEAEIQHGIVPDRGEDIPYVETGKCGENVSYRIENGTAYIYGIGAMFDYKDREPSPFHAKSNIKKVVIEEGVETIGDYAFYTDDTLEEVVLPKSLKEIGDYSFLECHDLRIINFPEQLKSIGSHAFDSCYDLKEAIISDSVNKIGSNAFCSCWSMEKLHLPANLEYIESRTFSTTDITELVIPKNVKSIGYRAFGGCVYLENIIFSDNIIEISQGAFESTKWMENQREKNPMVIVNGILIDMNACTGEAVIPTDVKKVADTPLKEIGTITKIVIPKTVEELHEQSFSNWYFDNAEIIYVEEDSVAEQYMKEKYGTGYYVIKENGDTIKVVSEESVSQAPVSSQSPVSSVLPEVSEVPMSSEVPDTSELLKISELPEVVTKPIYMLGDIDKEDTVTLSDAQAILKISLKIEKMTTTDKILADVNSDNRVTLEDAQVILKAALRIIEWNKTVELSGMIPQNIIINEPISTWEPYLADMEDPDFQYVYIEPSYPIVPMKPVIYLYPEETTEIEVELDFNGDFTFTWPDYRDGWKVIAEPDGKLTDTYDGSEHHYLFWEGKSNVQYTFNEGFCVKGEDTATFLKWALEEQGLTPKEYNDFITFWVPRMQENEYNVISFVEDIYTDNAKLSFSQEPDTMKRVFMAWYGSDEEVAIEEQELTGFERTGFTVVEWGGAEVSPSSYKQ